MRRATLPAQRSRIPTTLDWITARAAPTSATSRMLSLVAKSKLQLALQPLSKSARQRLGARAADPHPERSALHRDCGQDNSLTDVGNDRPNLVPGVNPYAEVKFHKGTGEANREYLNPAAFARSAPAHVNHARAARARNLRKHQQELLPWPEAR